MDDIVCFVLVALEGLLLYSTNGLIRNYLPSQIVTSLFLAQYLPLKYYRIFLYRQYFSPFRDPPRQRLRKHAPAKLVLLSPQGNAGTTDRKVTGRINLSYFSTSSVTNAFSFGENVKRDISTAWAKLEAVYPHATKGMLARDDIDIKTLLDDDGVRNLLGTKTTICRSTAALIYQDMQSFVGPREKPEVAAGKGEIRRPGHSSKLGFLPKQMSRRRGPFLVDLTGITGACPTGRTCVVRWVVVILAYNVRFVVICPSITRSLDVARQFCICVKIERASDDKSVKQYTTKSFKTQLNLDGKLGDVTGVYNDTRTGTQRNFSEALLTKTTNTYNHIKNLPSHSKRAWQVGRHIPSQNSHAISSYEEVAGNSFEPLYAQVKQTIQRRAIAKTLQTSRAGRVSRTPYWTSKNKHRAKPQNTTNGSAPAAQAAQNEIRAII
ncbi:uncharacterized protein BCR38DRAFT_478069 [Pseudomassariella vexata]|uniref:Uncharacterized protein n=1 Tax=Pseudomassariella vexata TaxID=1141098 RepID=A0A1Y2DF64_9PEZI|nr:uncharacterized protein BCR38DRAFT_478069 [Pseudomassariella vexata]ORY57744.1 hypothetical protein BCR38DRAFT_478069 [Pseudomassariella vexata]